MRRKAGTNRRTNCIPPLFTADIPVLFVDCEGVVKDLSSKFEVDPVLSDVDCVLLLVSLEAHADTPA